MKNKSCLTILLLFSIMTVSIVNKTIAQDRNIVKDKDGNSYKTIRIGTQIWMAENLKTTRFRDGTIIPNVTDDKEWSNLTSPGYCWYTNDAGTNKNTYGALYNWYTTADGNLCPTGWHVPCDAEWSVLITALGGSNIAGSKMKETGTAHWNNPNTEATNETGFTALPGGYREDKGKFSCIGNYGFLWSTTELLWDFNQIYTQYNWGRYLCYFLGDVNRYYFNKKYGFSVRCLIDTIPSISTIPVSTFVSNSAIVGGHISSDSNIPVTERGVYWGLSQKPELTGTKLQIGKGKGTFSTTLLGLVANTTYYIRAYAINNKGTAFGDQISFKTASSSVSVTDVEGNVYKIVTIGSQVWMAENLKTTKYNEGTSIPQVKDEATWNNLSTPAYCWYNNDSVTYKTDYGALYNWYTVNSGKLCPTGWHVPTDFEWTLLTDYLGGAQSAGAKLKESGTKHWIHPNLEATNESGFRALPGGSHDGGFNGIGISSGWWSSEEFRSEYALGRRIKSAVTSVGISYNDRKQIGFSVRCLRD